jgi:hypothetical protein
MEAVAKRTRRLSRTRTRFRSQSIRGAKQICLAMTREQYLAIWHDAKAVHALIDAQLEASPELFPESMEGYCLKGMLPSSRKLPGIRLRQLRLANGEVYSLRPSFVLSYMIDANESLEAGLELMRHGVPARLVAKFCGRNANFWDRLVAGLGRNSLAGTTVRNQERLPQHLTADEHQAKWNGEKGLLAMTAGDGCILGLELASSANDAELTNAYQAFADETREIDPDYTPATVNTDGWPSTQNAWKAIFPRTELIRCFLHGFLKIRERCHKAHVWHERVWNVYRAQTAREFRAKMAAFRSWVERDRTIPAAVRDAMKKLWQRTDEYAKSYLHPGCRRTSNMVDRLMNGLYRKLYAQRGLHGHQASSGDRLRGWALLYNFCPFAPRAGRIRAHSSPAHRLNGKQYSENWLQNLLLSASLGGRPSGHRKR